MTNRYLLNKWRVERLDQARCSDVTYLPTRRWIPYLVTTMDGDTRKADFAAHRSERQLSALPARASSSAQTGP